MAVTLQNLRSFISGSEPTALLPGQLCYNLADRIVYVGDGTSVTTSFDGTTSPGVAGQGWYSMPMDFSAFKDYFVANPQYYGDIPTDNQVLTWSTSLNHPIWTSGGGGGGGAVYEVTNNQVAVAPGITVSDKIISATGVVSPDEGDTCIVQGLPGEVYQGLYLFTTEWVRAASYAYPTAAQVTYDPAVSGLPAINVQVAVDSLDVAVTIAQNTANTANSTANSAQATALAALPKAGGTMTGVITFAPGQIFPVTGIQDASLIQKGVVQGGGNMIFPSSGVIDVRGATISQTGVVQLTNSTTTTSATLALTATGAKSLQDQIDNLTLANSVTLAGTLNAATGIVDSVTPDGTAAGFTVSSPLPSPSGANQDYYVIVSQGGNYNPPGGGGPYSASSGDWFLSNGSSWQYLGVGSRPAYASTTTPGIVQLADNGSTQSGTSAILAVTPAGLQSKLSDSTSTTSSTTIASSTAVKSAYDLANAALPKAGGTMTGGLCTQTVNVLSPYSITFASGTNGSLNAISDATNITSSTTAASSTALKAAYDLANDALPRAGGTMTGDLTFSGGGVGINFQGGSVLNEISDSVALTSSVTAASSTAVKTAYDLADAAIPDSAITAKGDLIGGTGAATYSALAVGADGTQLVANSACATGLEWISSGVTGTAPIQVDNTDPLNPVVSIDAASTSQPGAVQLNDTTSSTSTTEALTANQGYSLQQQINALAVSNNLTLAGTIDGSTGLMLSVTAEGTLEGFTVGAAMPAPAPSNSEYFTIVTNPGTMTPPGGAAQAVNDGDWWLSNGTAWQYLNVGYSAPYASTTVPGVIQLATNAEVQAGVETTHAVVPSSLQSKMSDSTSTTSSTTIASSTAVKAAYDLANAAIPKATFTAAGDILYGTGAGTYAALPIGTNGQSLIVSGGTVAWGASLAGYTCAATPFNTALGTNAGDSITTGINNTSLGYGSGTAITGGNNNTFVGFNSGDATTTSDNNTAVGSNALGAGGVNNNTAVGFCSGASLTTGSSNTFMGGLAGRNATTADNSVAVGYNAMAVAATANGSVAVGASALNALTSGAGNTAVGFQAADSVTTGARNTVVGHTSGGALTTGSDNTIVGACAANLATGTASTILGACAGSALTLGGANVFLGANAGDSVTTGFNNTIIGDVSGSTSLTGNLILAAGTTIKFQANNSGAWSPDGVNFGTAGQVLASQGSGAVPVWCTLSLACIPCSAFTASGQLLAGTGASTFTALTVGTNGQFLVADSTCTGGMKWSTECFVNDSSFTACGDLLVGTGSSAFTALPTGTNNQILVVDTTCTTTGGLKWFTSQGASLCGFTCSSGNFSVALGFQAGGSLTPTGFSNVFVGYNAGCQMSGGDYNVAVGNSSLQGTGCANVAIGAGAMGQTASTGNNNVAIGYQSADALTSGANNIAIGQGSLGASTTASDQVAVGHQAGCTNTVGAQSVYVGSNAGLLSNSVGSTFIGFGAGCSNTTAGCTTYLGYISGRNATGLSNTYVGGLTGCAASNTSACGTLLGFCAGSALTSGNGNVLIGFQSGRNVNSGANNVAIGTAAFQTATTAASNVAVGCGALAGLSSSAGNTALGHRAMLNASTATNNVVIGCSAGEQIATGSTNVFIGNTAGDGVTTGSNNTIIGDIAGSTTLADNLILAAGTTIKLQVNENGAVGVSNPPQYGTAGQTLQSSGTGGAPTWVTGATGSFTSQDGKTITVTNGIITSIV
jgi:hypothetical protein